MGRFGLDINKAKVEFMSNDSYIDIASRNPLISEINLNDDWRLVSYLPQVDKDLGSVLGIDMVKLINKYKLNEEGKTMYKDVSISISAAVTAYARIHISKLKVDILNRGGNIYIYIILILTVLLLIFL